MHFRALAIIFIVAGHAYWMASFATDTWEARFLINMIAGGTTYFVFISGYMFHHVYMQHFAYKKFVYGKIRNVLLPYLFISLPVTTYYLTSAASYSSENLFQPHFFEKLAKATLIGSTFQAYWFIPFILATFMLSPLHLRFARLGFRVQFSIWLVSFCIALFVHRPIQNINLLHSLIYFNPIYLLGIMVSSYRTKALILLHGREIPLLILAISTIVIQTTFGQLGNSHKAFFDFAWFDLMLVQKLTMTLALFAVFERMSTMKPRVLELISSTSFAIFFLHPIALIMLRKAGLSNLFKSPPLDLLLITISAVILCIFAAVAAKSVLGWRSRMVVGY